MTFVNIFLGTDTEFTHEANPRGGYDNPETLSFIATLVNSSEARQTDDVIQYQNDKVVVINGPTTRGTEVGERIARGVLAMLDAISRGETTICIAGHSRGAVEAILSSHELQRIKEICSTDSFSLDQILNSACSLTNTGIERFRERYQALNLVALKRNIAALKVSIFNIDPVPGGSIAGLGRWVAWRDERFYKIPSIVSSYYQIINENERTRAFKPIIPKADNPKTQYTIESLPGHHGTACGNLMDQQRGRPAEDGSDLVQKLTIAKLVKFLLEHEVAITPRGDFFSAGCAPTPELFLDLYRQTYEKKPIFERFNRTSYPVLGQEQNIERLLGWAIRDERIIHHGAHNDTFHNDIFPPIEGFLNQQHAHIALQHALKLTENKPLVDTFKTAIKRLQKICEHASRHSSPIPDETESMIGDQIAKVVSRPDPKMDQLLHSIIDSLMEDIQQRFLQNQFESSDVRRALIEAIISAYQEFKPLADENKFARPIFAKLKGKLEQTISLKQRRLTADYEQLTKKLAENHFMNELLGKIKILENTCRSLPKELVGKINTELETLNSDILNAETVKERLAHYQRHILELLNETLDRQPNTTLLLEIVGHAADTIENYTANSIFQQLKNIDEQHKQLEETVGEFKNMDATLEIGQRALDKLKEQQNRVLFFSAQYLIKYNLSLEDCREFLGEQHPLFPKIEAFFHGLQGTKTVTYLEKTAELLAANAMKDAFFDLNKELTTQAADLQAAVLTAAHQAAVLTAAHQAAVLTAAHQAAALAAAHQAEVAELTTQVAGLDTGNKEKDARIAALTQANQTRVTELTTQTEQLRVQVAQLNADNAAIDFSVEAQHKSIVDKLKILTKNYLEDLIKDVNKTFNVNLSINNNPLVLNAEAETELKNDLKVKFERVVELYRILQENNRPTLVTAQFYEQLTEANDILKTHHASDWNRFYKPALTILAVVLTGIIPGLIVLACTQFSMFSTPDQRFINQSEKILPPPPLRMNV